MKGYGIIHCPAYSFLIEYGQSEQKILFDLGVEDKMDVIEILIKCKKH